LTEAVNESFLVSILDRSNSLERVRVLKLRAHKPSKMIACFVRYGVVVDHVARKALVLSHGAAREKRRDSRHHAGAVARVGDLRRVGEMNERSERATGKARQVSAFVPAKPSLTVGEVVGHETTDIARGFPVAFAAVAAAAVRVRFDRCLAPSIEVFASSVACEFHFASFLRSRAVRVSA